MSNFKLRNFVSLFVAWTGLISIVSGVILYLAPAGRVAFWVNWHLFGLTKKQWEAVHTVSSFFLAIFVIWHLILNWKPFINYMKDKMRKINFTVPEFLWSLLIAVILTVMSIYSIPPVSYIMDFGEYLTASWESKASRPIIPHAEKLTLKKYCDKMNFPLDRAIKRLNVFNVKGVSPDKTLEEIAKENGVAPKDIADMLNYQKSVNEDRPSVSETKKTESTENSEFKDKDPVSPGRMRRGQGQGNFSGMMFIGKMNLKEFCEKAEISIDKAKNLLKKKGFGDIADNDMLRDIARKNGLMPRELGELLYSLREKDKTEK